MCAFWLVCAPTSCVQVLPEDLPTYNESIQRGMDNTAEWDFTFRVRVDGQIKHVHAQAQPMRIGCTGGVVPLRQPQARPAHTPLTTR